MTLKTARFLIPGVWRAHKCQGETCYLGADAAPNGQIFPARFKQFIDLETFLLFSKFKLSQTENKEGSPQQNADVSAREDDVKKSRV